MQSPFLFSLALSLLLAAPAALASGQTTVGDHGGQNLVRSFKIKNAEKISVHCDDPVYGYDPCGGGGFGCNDHPLIGWEPSESLYLEIPAGRFSVSDHYACKQIEKKVSLLRKKIFRSLTVIVDYQSSSTNSVYSD